MKEMRAYQLMGEYNNQEQMMSTESGRGGFVKESYK
jgi:hypothetical protein